MAIPIISGNVVPSVKSFIVKPHFHKLQKWQTGNHFNTLFTKVTQKLFKN